MADQNKTSYRQPLARRLFASSLRGLHRIAPTRAAGIAEHLLLTPPRRRRRQEEDALLTQARPRRIALDHHRIQVYSFGEGPGILLVHGWAGRPLQFARWIEPLQAAGLRPVLMDLPAHGASSGRRTNAMHNAKAIRRVAEAEGISGIVAHSMAGLSVATTLAEGLDLPAVLINTASDPHYLTQAFRHSLDLPKPMVDQVTRRIEQRLGRSFESMDALELSTQLKTPVLLIHDEHDSQVHVSQTRRLIPAWRQARAIYTQGLGHNRILAEPDIIETATDFLLSELQAAPAKAAL